jgi:hypothetical protein
VTLPPGSDRVVRELIVSGLSAVGACHPLSLGP